MQIFDVVTLQLLHKHIATASISVPDNRTISFLKESAIFPVFSFCASAEF